MNKRDRYDSLLAFYLTPPHPVPWKWGKAQAMAESAMNPQAVSHCGAKGLMQFMDATFLETMGPGRDPFNPEDSIQAYALYSKWLLTYLDTADLEKMAAAYNCGAGRVKNAGESWKEHLPDETNGYIRRIKNFYAELTQGDA